MATWCERDARWGEAADSAQCSAWAAHCIRSPASNGSAASSATSCSTSTGMQAL